MSDLERILKLAGFSAGVEAQRPAVEREMKTTEFDSVEEAETDDVDYIELADWADTWASKNGIDFGDYDDYGINELADDFAEDDIDTKEKAMEYIKQMSYRKTIDEEEIDEEEIDENAFNQAAAAAARAGKDSFEFNGKTYKTKMDKETAHKLDDDVQFESEELEEAACGCCGNTPCDCGPDCDCRTNESAEEILEAPTMDTTQLVILLKNAGLSEEAIEKKINEWANSAPDAAEQEQTSHGEPYENFAQAVNLSLKRYLDAENMKVNVSEHTVENMKALYESKKSKSK